MDMWNRQRASVVNQMSTNAHEDDDHHSMQSTQKNSPTNATKYEKKIQDRMEEFLEQIVNNSSSLISSFQATTKLLKNMDAHMTTLV